MTRTFRTSSKMKTEQKRLQKDADAGYKQFNKQHWVAKSNGVVVGAIGIKPVQRQKLESRKAVSIYNLVVSKQHRGSGLAAALLQTVEKHCRTEEIEKVKATTQHNLTAAVKFYEKKGYKLRPKCGSKTWDAFTLYYYEKELN